MANSRSSEPGRRSLSLIPSTVRYVTGYYLLIRKNGEVSRTGPMNLIDIQTRIIEEMRGASPDDEFEIRYVSDGSLMSATGGRWSRSR